MTFSFPICRVGLTDFGLFAVFAVSIILMAVITYIIVSKLGGRE